MEDIKYPCKKKAGHGKCGCNIKLGHSSTQIPSSCWEVNLVKMVASGSVTDPISKEQSREQQKDILLLTMNVHVIHIHN